MLGPYGSYDLIFKIYLSLYYRSCGSEKFIVYEVVFTSLGCRFGLPFIRSNSPCSWSNRSQSASKDLNLRPKTLPNSVYISIFARRMYDLAVVGITSVTMLTIAFTTLFFASS